MSKMQTPRFFAALVWSAPLVVRLLPIAAGAAEPTVDKSAYHLFNPTPADFLRDFDIDGPGRTESPYTVDAGHFQVEMTMFSYSSYRERFDGVIYRLDWWSVGPINIKVGLLNRLDLQLVLEPYHHFHEREDGFSEVTRSGFGDTTLRFKLNCWGNDSGRTALALIPYVKFPTSAEGVGSDHVEGGLAIPLAVTLPWEFDLGLTTRFTSAQDILGGNGQHAEFHNSMALGRPLFGDLEGYVEFYSAVSTEREVGWVGTFNSGLVYWLSDNIQLNAGIDFGVTRWADDWFAFVGTAWRF